MPSHLRERAEREGIAMSGRERPGSMIPTKSPQPAVPAGPGVAAVARRPGRGRPGGRLSAGDRAAREAAR